MVNNQGGARPRRRRALRIGSVAGFSGVVLGLPLTVLGAMAVQIYGLTLFIGVPFALGFVATLLHSRGREEPPFHELIAAAWLAVLALGCALVLTAAEGLVCLVMAWPLALLLTTIGSLVARLARRMIRADALGAVVILAVPGMFAGEATLDRSPALKAVHTSVFVAAPPEIVWRYIVEVPPLDPPTELVFRLGVAYPTEAVIEGRGVGAIRRCRFTTGDFVEPITVWEPARRLAFTVAEQPEPLRELSPYDRVHAPHLDGYLSSERGEFLLDRVPGGTRLTGTTWYRNHMWPERYWTFWSDRILHQIHGRVLRHVKQLAEQPPPRADQADRNAPGPPTVQQTAERSRSVVLRDSR